MTRSPAFSHEGAYVAWLYRPYVERRHGSDLYILNVKSGETRRVTSVSTMAEFQSDTRKVKEDRIKKARKRMKAEGKKDASASGDGGQADRFLLGRLLKRLTDGRGGEERSGATTKRCSLDR